MSIKTVEERIKEGNVRIKSGKKNRRLTSKQYKNLIASSAKELGINDKKYKVLDLQPKELPKDKTSKELVEDVIICLSDKHYEIVKDYEKITSKRRLKIKDRLTLLRWLIDNEGCYKPFPLLTKKEKNNNPRDIGLKKWGDVTEHPLRVIPDEEFLNKQNRKKHDAFDRLKLDKKIEWARHANMVLKEYTNVPLKMSALTEESLPTIDFAMRYACKLAGISNFKGIFAEPYWIIDRAAEFWALLNSKEYAVFMEMVLGKKPISRIVTTRSAIDKLAPTLKNMGLYEDYSKWVSKNKDKPMKGPNNFETLSLRKANSLINRKVRKHRK